MRSLYHVSSSIILAIVLFCSVLVIADFASAQEQPAAAAQAASPEIQAVLEKIIHLKKAKVGDAVSARVTAGAKLKDGTEITKGSHLTGKITEVKSKPDAEGPAKLGLIFDQAQLKDGRHVPVTVALMSVAPPWQPGGVDIAATDNKMSGAHRTENMDGGSASNPTSAASTLARGGLGIRAPAAATDPSALRPGVSYLEDIVLASYSMGEPGTVLESKKGTFYIDSGCRLLFMGQ